MSPPPITVEITAKKEREVHVNEATISYIKRGNEINKNWKAVTTWQWGEEVEKLIVHEINNLVNLTCNKLNITPKNTNTEIADTGASLHYLNSDAPHTNGYGRA